MQVSVDDIIAQEPALVSHAYTVGIRKAYCALQQVAAIVAPHEAAAKQRHATQVKAKGRRGKQVLMPMQCSLNYQTMPAVLRERSQASGRSVGRRRRRRTSEMEVADRTRFVGHGRRAQSAPLQQLPQPVSLAAAYELEDMQGSSCRSSASSSRGGL